MGTNHFKAAAAAVIAGVLLCAANASAEVGGSYPYVPVQDYATSLGLAGVADFDGDGHLDLVLQGDHSLEIAKGDGSGGFSTPTKRGPAAVDAVTIADFDGDGTPDLATAAQADGIVTITVSRGIGNGTFGAVASTELPAGANQSHEHGYFPAVASGDFDGDGDADIAVRGNNSVANLRWENDTLLTPVETPVSITPSPDDDPGLSEMYLLRDGPAAVGDFDEDGSDDLVLEAQSPESGDSELETLTGRPDGTFAQVTTNPGSGVSSDFTVADYDGDGHLDILGNGSNPVISHANLVIKYGLGDGGFESGVTRLSGPTGYLKPALTDVDLDGDLDVSSLNLRGRSSVFEHLGPRDWGGEIFGDDAASHPLSVLGADFNEDGWPDIALARDGRLQIELNRLSPEVRDNLSHFEIRLGKLALPASFHHLGARSSVNGTCSVVCSVRVTLRIHPRVRRRTHLRHVVIASTRTRWAPGEDNSTDLRMRRSAVRALRHYPGRSLRVAVLVRGTAAGAAGGGVQHDKDTTSVALDSGGNR